MLDLDQIRDEVVRPTLQHLDAYRPGRICNDAAVNLVMGTGLIESGFKYVRQIGGGPARGFWQMEQATHDWLFHEWLNSAPTLETRIKSLLGGVPNPMEQITSNIAYACAMCRLRYWVTPNPLPAADDVDGLAAMWKAVYNTHLGAGKEWKFVAAYRKHLL